MDDKALTSKTNLILARSKYIHDLSTQVSEISDPYTTVLMIMRELNKNMRKIADPAKGAAFQRKPFSNAFTAIYVLQSSLDFAHGGEIAENLFQLYEYFRQQLLKAFARNQDHNIGTCVVLLDEIIQAWEGIGQEKGKVTA